MTQLKNALDLNDLNGKQSMEIGIFDKNTDYCNNLCSLVTNLKYTATPIHSLENLVEYLKNSISKAIILNIDTMEISNRDIKTLSRKYNEVTFLCISESRFNPKFKEAIRNHVFACLNKPIDLDELNYFLKSIKKSKP